MRTPSRLILVVTVLLVGLALVAGSPAAAAQPQLPSPSRWPLNGPVRQLRGFDPPKVRWAAGHRGIDLAANLGQPVLAAADGTVTFAGRVAGRGVVSVQHGAVRTTYEPVSPAVRVGARVRIGQPIGTVAAGSHCSRPCLHWGLREQQTYLDPAVLGGGQRPRLRLLSGADRAAAVRRAALEQAVSQAAGLPAWTGLVGRAIGHRFVRPVAGPVTSGFAMRLHPVLKVWKLHDGTDFGAACGTPIVAAAAGTVVAKSFSSGYGNRLMLAHGDVDGVAVQTSYNHAERYVVSAGQRVSRGQLVGFVGSTGYSTGCHLHLMVWRDGSLVNPMRWLPV
ncbi:MAG: Membrane proteins related to metalloendopeptidases [uncultured Propionibacteriaceae bacterium]|uniref:Membrane proteins related to metalloendopeptidases n=1 Tax=uncultured Propionibacteriaceae bacterium TaxID=257457 RepID=A0A6J4NF02_9ACTN|nr:MAG: Membrane proteins related to metalloendopeptidases [uncultured Propionibacteriaceae bacterium]